MDLRVFFSSFALILHFLGLDKLSRPLIKVFYSCVPSLLVIGPEENECMDVYEEGSLARDAIETTRLRDADAIYVHGQ